MFTSFEDVVNRPPPYQWTEPYSRGSQYFGAAVVRIELVFQIAVILTAAIECCLHAGTESIRIRIQTAYWHHANPENVAAPARQPITVMEMREVFLSTKPAPTASPADRVEMRNILHSMAVLESCDLLGLPA